MEINYDYYYYYYYYQRDISENFAIKATSFKTNLLPYLCFPTNPPVAKKINNYGNSSWTLLNSSRSPVEFHPALVGLIGDV